MKKIPIRILISLLAVFVFMLILLEIYIGYGLYAHNAIYRIDPHTIESETGDSLFYHEKNSEEGHRKTYTMNILGSDLLTENDYIYMVLYQSRLQETLVTLNGDIIKEYDDRLHLQTSSFNTILFVPIEVQDINKTNKIDFEIESSGNEGFYEDIFFVNGQVIKRMRWVLVMEYLVRSFIFYASIILSLGFILFSQTVVNYEDVTQSKVYQRIALSVLSFTFYSFNLVRTFNIDWSMEFTALVRTIFFALSLFLLLSAFYIQTKQRIIVWLERSIMGLLGLYMVLYALQLTSISLTELFKLLFGLMTLAGTILYCRQYKDLRLKDINWIIKSYIIIILLGRLLLLSNQIYFWIPLNIIDEFDAIIPLAIALVMIAASVFSEFLIIQMKARMERERLQSLNTNIYEYVSEGVFSVNQELVVNDTYTRVCQQIFEQDISGQPIASLINDKETSPELIERVLTQLFSGKIPWQAGTLLLPEQLIIDERYFAVSYLRVLNEGRISEIIIKLAEVTHTIELQSQITFERDKLALSITSVMNREELLPLVNEFMEFMSDSQMRELSHEELMNVIHTYKGNFGVFNFIHVIKALHDFETELIKGMPVDELECSPILEELYKDLEIITEVTGSSFFEDTLYLKANVNNLEAVYSEVKKYFYDTEASLIIFIIKKIFNRSLRDIILFYAREARRKAMEMGKEIKTIDVVGDEVFIDYNYYKNALRSLVHIFNNCVDHGIEDEEDRIILGKPRAGEILCRVSDYGNFFEILIKDDGRGIDFQKLVKRLVDKEILTEESCAQLTEEELIEYVFEGEISTVDEASITSGRGVGLASVKTEVEKVGGEIRMNSFMDFGTEIKILLPKENEALISYFSLPLLMDLYIEAFKIYIKSNNIFELPLNVNGNNKILNLHDYNVKIRFEGPESGYFFMSCNDPVMWELAYYLTENPKLEEDEFIEVAWEVIKETCNIVAGNSTSIFDLSQKYIDLLSPDEVSKDLFDISTLAYKWHLNYDDYDVILGLIIE